MFNVSFPVPLYGLEHRNFTFVEDELGLGDSNKEIVTIKRPGRHRKVSLNFTPCTECTCFNCSYCYKICGMLVLSVSFFSFCITFPKMCTYIHMHIHTQKYTCTYMHMYIPTHTHTHTRARSHTHTHTHTERERGSSITVFFPQFARLFLYVLSRMY
jgi:hypothetical protein